LLTSIFLDAPINCLLGKREALKIPLFGQLADPQWNIFVGRDTRDSKEERDQVIKDIEAR
jgi:hypothetical protein